MRWVKIKFDENYVTECDYYNKLDVNSKKYITEFLRSFYYGQVNKDFFNFNDTENKKAVSIGIKNKFAINRDAFSASADRQLGENSEKHFTKFIDNNTPEKVLLNKEAEIIKSAITSELKNIPTNIDNRIKWYYQQKIIKLMKKKLANDLKILN